jgi:hypothetical protein
MGICRTAEGVGILGDSEVLAMFVTLDGEILKEMFRNGIKYCTTHIYLTEYFYKSRFITKDTPQHTSQ